MKPTDAQEDDPLDDCVQICSTIFLPHLFVQQSTPVPLPRAYPPVQYGPEFALHTSELHTSDSVADAYTSVHAVPASANAGLNDVPPRLAAALTL